jgi:hypothetical protein
MSLRKLSNPIAADCQMIIRDLTSRQAWVLMDTVMGLAAMRICEVSRKRSMWPGDLDTAGQGGVAYLDSFVRLKDAAWRVSASLARVV